MTTKLSAIVKAGLCAGMITLFSFFSCEKELPQRKHAKAIINPTTDMIVQGSLNFIEQKDGTIKMDLEIYVPQKKESTVAIHLHEHGDCGNGGTNAHGHWNPTGTPHGAWHSSASHAGDIGNIPLDGEGRGRLTLTTNRWSINGDDLTNIVGRGVIVHSGVDDYTTQPAGNSGPRVGCGVIELK